jgi:hypothetical protein
MPGVTALHGAGLVSYIMASITFIIAYNLAYSVPHTEGILSNYYDQNN